MGTVSRDRICMDRLEIYMPIVVSWWHEYSSVDNSLREGLQCIQRSYIRSGAKRCENIVLEKADLVNMNCSKFSCSAPQLPSPRSRIFVKFSYLSEGIYGCIRYRDEGPQDCGVLVLSNLCHPTFAMSAVLGIELPLGGTLKAQTVVLIEQWNSHIMYLKSEQVLFSRSDLLSLR
ncbi:uncharacterized protein G2W53_036473 [Senna tora]|uniref:Uncharacterized protein n=1 Tax=Senna tora TaxID=362788 RepID=A0A834SVY3_9FABA|nr:uncharacterized protein G2W53_036473 [Senna tora]